jgi:hypothetical protein
MNELKAITINVETIGGIGGDIRFGNKQSMVAIEKIRATLQEDRTCIASEINQLAGLKVTP